MSTRVSCAWRYRRDTDVDECFIAVDDADGEAGDVVVAHHMVDEGLEVVCEGVAASAGHGAVALE